MRQRTVLFGLIAMLAAGAASAATVEAVTVEPAGADVRVTVKLSGAFDAPTTFALDAPQRLVVDLPGNKTGSLTATGAGPVKGARTAQFSAKAARLVIDLNAPMSIADATSADGTLTLILRPTEQTAFGTAVGKGRGKLPGFVAEAVAVAPAPAKPTIVATAPKPVPVVPKPAEKVVVTTTTTTLKTRPIETAALPPLRQPKHIVRPRAGVKPLVVIDAGHGGHDSGAVSVAYDNKREKDATLAISRAIADEINRSGRARAVLTRATDKFLVLRDRYGIARRAKADMFISVHADSAPQPEVRGATIYTLSEVASDREAARLAAKENKSDIIAGFNFGQENADVADILIDLAQRETMNSSAAFAATLQRAMSPTVHFRTNGHRFAGFLVLKAPDVPSVLLETGYLSNAEDARYLFSDSGRKAIAEGVAKAVDSYFFRRVAQR